MILIRDLDSIYRGGNNSDIDAGKTQHQHKRLSVNSKHYANAKLYTRVC